MRAIPEVPYMVIARAKSAVVVLAVLATACGGSSPTAPSTPAPALGAILLVPNGLEVPIGGGSVDIIVATATAPGGGVIAPNVDINLTTSAGTLSVTHVRTNSDGRALVTWTGQQTTTVRASAGELFATSVIRVAEPVPVPTPEPTPTPTPNPTPNPNPAPAPTPGPGGLFATITATPSTVLEGDTVSFSVRLDSASGANIPPIATFAWDLDGNGTIDSTAAAPTFTYPVARFYVPRVTLTTTDGRTVQSATSVDVRQHPDITQVSPAVLTPDPSTIVVGTVVTLGASVTGHGAWGDLTFAWDFNGDGTDDVVGPSNTATTSFATVGTHTVRVTVSSQFAGSKSATLSIVVK